MSFSWGEHIFKSGIQKISQQNIEWNEAGETEGEESNAGIQA